jgi:hypothetical protein
VSSLPRQIFGDQRDPREELSTIFDVPVPNSGDIQPEPLLWAKARLSEANIQDPVAAIRELRRAEPRLSLKTATYLAERATASN